MKWIFYIVFIFPVLSYSQKTEDLSTIRSVNFIQEGEVSKLIIDFDKPAIAEKNHLKSDKQIILDIKNVKADKKYLRGIDTSEFSGSAVFISPYKKPGSHSDLRFAIQLRDNIRSFIETKGNRLILHMENRFGVFSRTKMEKAEQGEKINNIVKDGEKVAIPRSNSLEDILENLTQSGIKRYVGKKISINVNSLSFSDVLKMIGDTSGFNIIIDDDVSKLKPLTISLVNLPWDQVLDTVMDLGDLVALKHGNILTIKTTKSHRDDLERDIKTNQQKTILEPLVTKIFPISFADITEITKIIESYLTPKRGDVQVDKRTQNLLVKDTVATIEKVKKIIDALDTQTPQVLIEAKIVEVSEKYEFKAGLTNGIKAGYNALTTPNEIDPGSAQFDLSSATGPENTLLAATINVARLTSLNFSLELMESESKGKIVTSPRIITENNKEAKILNTNQRFFTTAEFNSDGNAFPSTKPLESSIGLKVTPKVTNEGSILLKVDLIKSGFSTTEIDGVIPPIIGRSIETNILVENGSTVVVGGLYQTQDEELEVGIPFLKDLPLIGWIFRNSYNPKKERNELMVFITPRIINQEEAGLVNRELGDDLGI